MKKIVFQPNKSIFCIEEANTVNQGKTSFTELTEEFVATILDYTLFDTGETSVLKARGIDSVMYYTLFHKNTGLGVVEWEYTESPIESLHSFVKSLDFHLFEHPLGKLKDYKKKFKGHDMFFANYIDKWYELNDRTLYNPVIYKIN